MDGIKRRPHIRAKARNVAEYEEDTENKITEDETEEATDEEYGNSEGVIKSRRRLGYRQNTDPQKLFGREFIPESISSINYESLIPRSPAKEYNATLKYKKPKVNTFQTQRILRYLLYFLPLLIFVVTSISWKAKSTNVPIRDHETCFQELQEKYPQNKMILESLQIDISYRLNKTNQKSNVYLFTHYNDGDYPHKSNELIEMILNETSKCLDPHMEPIHMNLKNFKSSEAKEDYGLIIQEFKEKIKKSKIIVLENLNEIPFETARALHVICDTESPVDKDVIVFLTLKLTDKINENGNGLERDIERILNEMWGKLKNDELDALITRVTNNVFMLRTQLK